jgi:hypothetical protein
MSLELSAGLSALVWLRAGCCCGRVCVDEGDTQHHVYGGGSVRAGRKYFSHGGVRRRIVGTCLVRSFTLSVNMRAQFAPMAGNS